MRCSLRTLSAARVAVAIVVVALGWTAEAFAHHSTSYYSKEQKDFVNLQGKVVRWEFRSPHSQIYLEVTGQGRQSRGVAVREHAVCLAHP